MKYHYLVVGAGLFGAVFAHEAAAAGKRVLVVEKRSHVAGNAYTQAVEGIQVHRYGAHILHTNNARVWEYVNRFVEFSRYTHSPVANYHGEIYSLPFSMHTFHKMWGVATPAQAAARLEEQRREITGEPRNLEEKAITMVGRDVYERLIRGYTQKQWGRDCRELPPFIIERLPVRYTYDADYFGSRFQGIPVKGYTTLASSLLSGIEVLLDTDYLAHRADLDALAQRVVFTGPIDAYYSYQLGFLQYRTVRFETELLDIPNFQGASVVNYTDTETPWTRIIEHKWLTQGRDENGNELGKTIISREYSDEWRSGDEPFYPVNDQHNSGLYAQYKAMASTKAKVVFGGRLGEYRYYDMDEVIAAALSLSERELGR